MAYCWQQVTMEFVETPVFNKLVLDLFSDDEYRELQARLAQYPDSGVVIQDASGLRKIRWAAKGQGKRGGVRVIYYWAVTKDLVYMIYAYQKTRQTDLSPEQLKTLRKTVEQEFP
jgi:mRNA-degrading endonuclease RelE of RelBE toxin-antitoxin system